MIKRIVQKIKNKKIGKNTIIFYLPDEKKSRLRAFARTRAKNILQNMNYKSVSLLSRYRNNNSYNSYSIYLWKSTMGQ